MLLAMAAVSGMMLNFGRVSVTVKKICQDKSSIIKA